MATTSSSHSYSEIYKSLPRNAWLQRFLYTLHALALPLAFYIRPLWTALAFIWLVHRAWQVLNTPLKVLSTLLGLDLPATPHIDLARVEADSAIIHWSLPEKPKQKKEHKFAVHLNGQILGSVSVYESAVEIIGLLPNTYYIVRVALVNSHEFSSKSTPIRFETKPAASSDCRHDVHDTDTDVPHESLPRIRAYRNLKDITPASPLSTPMAREGSSGLAPRRISGRRPSPANLILGDKHDPQPDDSEAPEGAETIQQLTERLDALRRENEEAEKLLKDEEEEELKQKEELIKERDELRAELNEKEKNSRNLKREVVNLERQNAAAHNERSKQERLLQQKQQERQKLKDDMVRWEQETEQMKEEAEAIRREKEQYLEKAEEQKVTLRSKIAEEQAAVRGLDEEVKEKTSEIKKLERALKTGSPEGTSSEPNLVQQMQQEAEEDRAWAAHKTALQQQYAASVQRLGQAQAFHEEQLRYLQSLRAERTRQEELAQRQSHAQDRLPTRADSQRSRQAASHNSASDSPRLATFPPSSQSPFLSTVNPASSPFSSTLLFNMKNGMTIPSQPTDDITLSEEERDRLTGGALMSPGAGRDLIPTDLFSGEDNRQEHITHLAGLGAPIPGLASGQDYIGAGPASPASASSRSPSLFASPQASQHNLGHIGSPEGALDADRRSIRSTRSNRAPSGSTGSRFGSMFGIKQRSKNLSSDAGPPLSKASSMPRADNGLMGLDAVSRKRTSSISGNVLPPSADDAPASRASRSFNLLKSGGWPTNFASFSRRPTSPRPGSTHSNELPRPSFDSSSTRWPDVWPPNDASAGAARNSPLSFGPVSRVYGGSRHTSRRPSVQYGASGPPEDILEDEDSDALSARGQEKLAPIGTKPRKSIGTAAVSGSGSTSGEAGGKLNPNAKVFGSFLSSMKFGKDKESKDKTSPLSSRTDAGNAESSFGPDFGEDDDGDSPPASRKSRDTRSMTTTESSILASDGGRVSGEFLGRVSSTDTGAQYQYGSQFGSSQQLAPSPSLLGTSSGSSSWTTTATTGGKETLMQKISRKSSSGKFTLPTFKRAASRQDASGPTSVPQQGQDAASFEEEAEEGASMRESREFLPPSEKAGRGSGRGWGSVLKLGKGKKGGEAASVVSGVSVSGEEEVGGAGSGEDE